MKIISKGECYIQGYDLDRMLMDDRTISTKQYMEALSGKNATIGSNYYKIDDKDLIDTIINDKNILDFANFANGRMITLRRMLIAAQSTLSELSQDYVYQTNSNLKNVHMIAEYRKKMNRENMIKQIKEIMNYIKGEYTNEYPVIPSVSDDELNLGKYGANYSMDHKKILIYNMDGTPIIEDLDIDFCKGVFNTLINDYKLSLPFKMTKSDDAKYLVLEKQQQKSLMRIKRN